MKQKATRTATLIFTKISQVKHNHKCTRDKRKKRTWVVAEYVDISTGDIYRNVHEYPNHTEEKDFTGIPQTIIREVAIRQ